MGVTGLERVVPLPSPESGGWPGRLASRLAGLAELRPPEDASRLAREVRALGFARYSDGELKDALADIQGDALPWVFAIVDEAVSRRLGAWRLFDEGHAHPLSEIAGSIVDRGVYRSDPGCDTDGSYLNSAAFSRVIQDAVTEAGLGDLDIPAVVLPLEERAGFQVRRLAYE